MMSWLALLLSITAACGDDRGSHVERDAMVDVDGSTDEPAIVVARPNNVACARGWSSRAGEPGELGEPDDLWCEPWEASAGRCTDPFEARFIGDDACHPIGRTCPAGPFPDDLSSATGPVVYVLAGAAAGGDGSIVAPFDTISGALTVATRGTLVAIGKGRYPESIGIRSGITLRGACVAETIIAGAFAGPQPGTLTVLGDDVTIRDLQITGDRAGIWMNGTSATIEGVLVDGALLAGIGVGEGAELTGTDVVVRNTREGSDPAHRLGVGLLASDGARASLTRTTLEQNHTAGAMVLIESEVTLDAATIRDTLLDSDGRFGRGVIVEGAAHLTLHGSLLEGNHDCAATVANEGDLILDASLLRGTLGGGHGGLVGCGLGVSALGTALVTASRIDSNLYYGAAVRGAGSTLRMVDTTIARTTATDAGSGVGVLVNGEASLVLERVRLTHNVGTGLLVQDGRVTLTDVTIDHTASDPFAGDNGRGLEVNSGGVVTGDGAWIEGNTDGGIVVAGAGSSCTLSRVAILDTRERACVASLCTDFGHGVGLSAILGGTASLTNFDIRASALAGVQLLDGDILLSDGDIRGNPIGANVQNDAFDVGRISTNVRYTDNDLNLSREHLAGPDTTTLFGGR